MYCANYSSTGPFNKIHYCWLAGSKCCLHPDIDMGCFYFVNAVLPLDKKLQAQWLEANPPLFERTKFSLNKDTKAPKVKPQITGYRVCGCGKEFAIKSHRQTRCSDCSKTNKKKSVAKAVRRHRKVVSE